MVLLRYRFGDVQQLQNHLHVVEGRTLFFWRDGKGELAGGTRITLEFSFSTSEQVTLVRGTVLGRVGDAHSEQGLLTGLWLELPDSRLAKRLDLAGSGALSARKQRRLGCDLMIELRQGRIPTLGRMTDVSLAGCRVTGTQGLRANLEVEIRNVAPQAGWPAQLGRAQVLRVDGGDAGLRFVRSDATSRMAASKLFQLVQQAWADAPELVHPTLCCREGRAIEPALPHVWGRV